MKPLRSIAICGLIWTIMLHGAVAWARMAAKNRRVETVTTYSYTAGADEPPETANALTFFGAKYKAVAQTADQLAEAGLLNADANRKMAIFCLVADAMPSRVIEQSMDAASRTYTIKIKSTLYLADFVKAEIRNEALDKAEKHFSLKEEMEPAVTPAVAPALELSRAYRYISHGRWRMAIIYMDHLETKYPHWGALNLAKARAYLGMHAEDRALSALNAACYMGVQEACLKIIALDPPD
jgi:hypothetical protein